MRHQQVPKRQQIDRPRRQLLGFARVALAAGEERDVEVLGSLRPLARRDAAGGIWGLVSGDYVLEAAQFSGDTEAATTPTALSRTGHEAVEN